MRTERAGVCVRCAHGLRLRCACVAEQSVSSDNWSQMLVTKQTPVVVVRKQRGRGTKRVGGCQADSQEFKPWRQFHPRRLYSSRLMLRCAHPVVAFMASLSFYQLHSRWLHVHKYVSGKNVYVEHSAEVLYFHCQDLL